LFWALLFNPWFVKCQFFQTRLLELAWVHTRFCWTCKLVLVFIWQILGVVTNGKIKFFVQSSHLRRLIWHPCDEAPNLED
jgi:hypothetical protein